MDLLKKKKDTKKIDAQKFVMSSEKYRWILTNKRIQVFGNSQRGRGLLQAIFTS